MHISLDSALGRQRRLNSVGESVLQIAPNAAAAYSLRSLTGGDPKVVRVRRGSDNHEQDFTASEVSSGALTSFVNAQVVAPLDIQALSATGRDGDFLIAKAAYSLRSLGTRQATLAATGDTVARADGKYVCQVRRSSDDALKSFTATEVTDGTLLAFVNEIQTLGTVTNSSGNNGFTLTNASSTGFTATTDTATGVCGWPYTAESGDKITVSFDAVIRSGTPQFLPRRATALSGSNLASVVSDSPLSVNSTGSYSFEFTYDDNLAGSLTFSEGDDNADFDISNFQVTVFKGAGLVKTWYDQSVTTQAGDTATGNHATQSTAASQPKIVSAGALNTSGGLEFDSTDDFFALTSSVSFQNLPFALFSVQDAQPDTNHRTLGCANARGVSFISNQTNYQFTANSATFTFSSSVSGLNLYSALHDGTTNSDNITSHRNGSAPSTSSGSGLSQANSSSAWTNIGVKSGSSDFFHGTIKEIIVYNTDQTDNRTAIEANIGEAYSIDLPSGVDPGFDQVDGFVETWYDQSGNNNHAVQATAAEQPKIVDAGSLLTAGVTFDGADSLSISGEPLIEASSSGVFSAFSVQTVATSEAGYLYGNASPSNGASFYANTDKFTLTNKIAVGDDIPRSSGQNLLSAVYNNGDAGLLVNGAGTMTDVGTYDFSTGTGDFIIGNRNGGTSAATFLIGSINEIIIYNSNQSSNRTALETEIISHYGIS